MVMMYANDNVEASLIDAILILVGRERVSVHLLVKFDLRKDKYHEAKQNLRFGSIQDRYLAEYDIISSVEP
jgi:hypothetical protein